jgi:hypothetical protein
MPDFHVLPDPVRAKLVKSVRLTFCEVRQYRDDHLWTWTQFPDGAGYGATPDFSDGGAEQYAKLARRLGYDTVDDYCFVHEFCHSYLEQELAGRASPVLWALAHKRRHPDHTVWEEALVLAFQRFMHGNDYMHATAPDIDWFAIRSKALRLLALAEDPVRDPAAAAALR